MADPLQKRFHDFIKSESLFEEDDHILIAVSGGIDSMVLATLFLRSGYKFSVAHCNFGLREEESDSDQKFVEDWASKNKVKLHVNKFAIEGSIQTEAREARYRWFNSLLEEFQYSFVATAHHFDDSIETFFLNLSRGTGIKGLTGISAKNERTVRPLLYATKGEIEEYAKDQGINWREDSSNQKTDYKRNLIRKELIPILIKLNPSFSQTFKSTIERLHFTEGILENEVSRIRNRYVSDLKDELIVDLKWVDKEEDLLILSMILSEYGVNYVTAKEVFETIGQSGKTFETEKYNLSMDRTSLHIERNGYDGLENFELKLNGFGEFEKESLKFLLEESDASFSQKPTEATLDRDQLTFPLIVRPWKQGDSFIPLGMNGQKKISDFLIDKKIPLVKKKDILVIESNREIVWVVGHRISDRFKTTDNSENCIRITFSKT